MEGSAMLNYLYKVPLITCMKTTKAKFVSKYANYK